MDTIIWLDGHTSKISSKEANSNQFLIHFIKYNYNLKYYRDIPWEDNYMTEEVVE